MPQICLSTAYVYANPQWCVVCFEIRTSLVAQIVKDLPTMRKTWVWSLGREETLEKEMATHSSTLAWKIPWMEEPGRLHGVAKSWTWLSDFTLFSFFEIRKYSALILFLFFSIVLTILGPHKFCLSISAKKPAGIFLGLYWFCRSVWGSTATIPVLSF